MLQEIVGYDLENPLSAEEPIDNLHEAHDLSFLAGTGRFGFCSIRAWQIGFVCFHPAHPAATVAVGRWLPRRYIVEGTGGNNGSLAVARGVRNWTITVTADLSAKLVRL